MTEKNNFEILEDKEIQAEEIINNEKLKVYKGYVGFWKRFASSNLDGILYFLIIPAGYLLTSAETYQIIQGILVFIGLLIHTYFYFKESRGLGYKIMKFLIINKESGKKADVKKLVLRALYKYLPIILILVMTAVFFFKSGGPAMNFADPKSLMSVAMGVGILALISSIYYLVNAIMVGTTKNKEALWDKWAGTLVVSEKEWNSGSIWAINIVALLLATIVSTTPMEKEISKNIEKSINESMEIRYEEFGEDNYINPIINGSIKINGEEINFNKDGEVVENNKK